MCSSDLGFVPITSVVAGFRRSIKHTFSDNWVSFNILEPKDSINYGITGYVFRPYFIPGTYKIDTVYTPTDTVVKVTKISQTHTPEADLSWVKYEAPTTGGAGLKDFGLIKLYYGPASDGNYIEYTVNGIKHKQVMTGKAPVNEYVLYDGTPEIGRASCRERV